MVLRFTHDDLDAVGPIHDRVAAKVNELGKSMGAIHHDVYVSRKTGEFVVIDEWRSPEDAERFWATDTFRSALAEEGLGPPTEVYVLERAEGDPLLRF
jgi:quinol monooxygenase YgiN